MEWKNLIEHWRCKNNRTNESNVIEERKGIEAEVIVEIKREAAVVLCLNVLHLLFANGVLHRYLFHFLLDKRGYLTFKSSQKATP